MSTSEEPQQPSQLAESLLTIVRSQFEYFAQDSTRAPKLAFGPHRSIGIDNQQRHQYNLAEIRSWLYPDASIVQVVGDSGTPFDEDKVPVAQAILSSHVVDGAAIEYGFTAAKHDTNWLVNEHQRSHPQTRLIANLVEQMVGALESGMEGSQNVSTFVLLFDRLVPTRYGDDVWLSDGIMSKERGDKMLCFEGGPQALYQCSNVLLKGLQVVAVTNLRSARFSAARFLTAFKGGFEQAEEYLNSLKPTAKQVNVARWCLSSWRESDCNVGSLILSVDASYGEVSPESCH